MIEPIIRKVEISVDDIKSYKKDFYKSIGEGNEEGIIKVLEELIDN